MSAQTLKVGLAGASITRLMSGPSFGTAALIDASGEKAAFIFQVPRTGTLDLAEFRVGTVTFPGGTVVRASFQDLAGAGDADGTQDQYRDISSGVASNGWITPGLMTSDGTDTGTKRSVTQGQFLVFVVEYSTFVATASIVVSTTGGGGSAMPHVRLNTSGSWASPSSGQAPVIALKYSDGSYEVPLGCFPFSAITGVSFNTGSTPDERGLFFQVAYPTRLHGLIATIDAVAAGRDFSVVLYQVGNNTPLATLSVDADYTANFGGTRGGFYVFSSNIDIAANTNYRLVIKPGTASSNTLQEFDVGAAAIMDCFEGGQNWHHTSRTDGATTGGTLNDGWTQTTTKRPFITPIFDQFDDAAGALRVASGMYGGFR